ncbi:HD-GYP domain-containing protein [Paenibacillus agaridevorans]|uniref:HD-GYP domain-containing protein n=1 Tax=Paenibacillus agaridevorans TaxID=171404 RepID=UPI001BE4949D|nr:HD domain-containing phosphohydrolase [Paenibacillus agaridevorans]
MLECQIDKLKEGDRLAKAVIGKNGMIILCEGTELTTFYIKRLKEMGVNRVLVKHCPFNVQTQPAPSVVLPPTTAKQRNDLYGELVNRLNRHVFCSEHGDSVKDRRFKRRYRRALADALAHPSVADWMNKLEQFDELIFGHAVNVSILSTMIGDEYGYTEAQLLELLLGSLLFDVGMTIMPRELVTGHGTLSDTDRHLLNQHAELGYRLLADIKGMPWQSAVVSLAHHERFDGSGYPFGTKGNDIPEYARIVALADSYDALTSPRRYRSSYRADDVVEFLYGAGNYYFDASLVKLFLQRLKAFPLSSVLTLSSGQTGIVTSYRSSIAHRPVVRIITEASGQSVGTPYELDLSRSSTITVLHAASQA